MKVVNLYKYTGNNGTDITPVDLGIPCEEMKRLVADEGKELVKGDSRLSCIDVLPVDVGHWEEEDKVLFDDSKEEEQKNE